MSEEFYGASTIKPDRGLEAAKKRVRATAGEMQERLIRIQQFVYENRPATVRQCFYLAECEHLVDKDEHGYRKIQQGLLRLREDGEVPFEWVIDTTRSENSPYTVPEGAIGATRATLEMYRMPLWANEPVHVQIWLEKSALAGAIEPVTHRFDVPLMVARGHASATFAHDGSVLIRRAQKPAYIYHLSDFDKSGIEAGKDLEKKLRQYTPGAEIHFNRLGLNLEQIEALNLSTRSPKDKHIKEGWPHDFACELDAIRPTLLRKIVQDAIHQHMSPKRYEELMLIEQQHRDRLREIVVREKVHEQLRDIVSCLSA